MSKFISDELIPLNVAVMTISDTRNDDTDTSGQLLSELITLAGHNFVEKRIVKDDIYQIRAHLSQWIADETTQVVVLTGGTGFTDRDSTPEAVHPLLDKEVLGFGELFRQVSFDQIGSSTIQSRALAGISNGTLIFCLPGSNNACKTGWNQLIKPQIDSRHKPCNFVAQLKNTTEPECLSRESTEGTV